MISGALLQCLIAFPRARHALLRALPAGGVQTGRGDRFNMDNPAARSLVEMVRQINEIGRRARSGEPGPDDYLRAVSSDPVTEWFTDLLREKNTELEVERDRADRLASALRNWFKAKDLNAADASQADIQLARFLRDSERSES